MSTDVEDAGMPESSPIMSPHIGRPERNLGAHSEGAELPLFMDSHHLGEHVSMADVAKAHEADLATQAEHDVNYLRYWVDEEAGQIFCLVEAPDAEAAATVHREAHGLIADTIFQVREGT